MKVLHLIPAAFNYFDDIRAEALGLVEELHKLGVASEALTIQFGSAQKIDADEAAVEAARPASAQHYQGTINMSEVEKTIDSFDAIHAHCPLFGAAGRLLHWKQRWPAVPLVATVYRRVKTPDFFSLLIVFYNWYYLPKIFRAADAITAASQDMPRVYFARSFKRYQEKFMTVDSSLQHHGQGLTDYAGMVELSEAERVAMKYFRLYSQLSPAQRAAELSLSASASRAADQTLEKLAEKNI